MKKYYIKKNIIGFIVGVILCTGTFVYAAVTFPSNEVTYDNTESGLTSNNVQGAIDELYTECTAEPAGEQIIENNNLEKDEYECRYFFTGANPNNYITFNNESWRIISIECDGTIKIMKTANINTSNNLAWNTEDSNIWNLPATLNTYLNGTYYISLNSTAKSQIVASNFSIGAVTYDNNDMTTQVSEENSNKWYGNIALPTVSEYIRTNSNKSSCGTFRLIADNYRSCVSTGWMDTTSANYWWTLSPCYGDPFTVHAVLSSGDIGTYYAHTTYYAVRPALYLSSDVKLSGSGTQSDPYVVS